MAEHPNFSPSMLVPYGADGHVSDYAENHQLADYTRSSPISRFRLPDGWSVKEVIRADGSRSDKYYVEPGTRCKFRSLKDVERRVNGEIDTLRQRSSKEDYSKSPSNQKMIVSGGKMLNLDDDDDDHDDQLAVISSNLSTYNSPSDLPDGWVVERVPRRRGVGSDKYYYEPGSGRKFRSLREVKRHLQADEIKLNYYQQQEPSEDRLPVVSLKVKHFDLPEGWVVKEVPRRFGKYTDKYYYEPGTGQKFRSLLAVKNYLSEPEENEADEKTLAEELEDLKECNTPLSKAFKLPRHHKNTIVRERDQNSSFNAPPKKIDWVLSSPSGDLWDPFISEKLVPDTVKQQWGKRFTLMMEKQD
jgi:hypothetical protein